MSALLPGDALLLSDVVPNIISRHINNSQLNAGLAEADARWTHVAVYIGKSFIVEAVPWYGVRTSAIYAYVPHRRILVRRPPDLTNDDRFQIAIEALTRIKKSYGLASVPRLALAAVAGLWRPQVGVRLSRALICSTLYSDAYSSVLTGLVHPDRSIMQEVWPAHLSDTPRLQDVAVHWLKLS